MSLKADNYLRSFRGRGQDFDTWWQKFLALAEISKWDDDDKKTTHLPLFLDGDAFLIFSKMNDADKKKVKEVKAKLSAAFAVTAAQAYGMFVNRRLKVDESVDAYVADLQRLLSQSGHKVSGDDDTVVIEQFIAGLSRDFARSLRLSFAGKKLKVSECVEQVRALRTAEEVFSQPAPTHSGDVSGALESGGGERGGRFGVGASSGGAGRNNSGIVCHGCGEVGHIRRFCPNKAKGQTQGRTRSGPSKPPSQLTCYFCDKPGHLKTDCPERRAWLRSRGQPAASADTTGVGQNDSNKSKEPCLCTVNTASRSGLPRIFVDARPMPTEAEEEWHRLRSVLDTGSARTLIEARCAEWLGSSINKDCTDRLVALDGKSLAVGGTVQLQLRREDGPVALSTTNVTAVVVESLSAVSAQILIGNDVVAGNGGVHVQYDAEGSLRGVTFGSATAACVSTASHPNPHVTVVRDDKNIILRANDGEVKWHADKRYWSLKWLWKGDVEPCGPIGPSIGEYSRKKLTEEQEKQFCSEVAKWIEEGWLVPHDPEVHGEPAAVLPLLAQVQEHKETTPVRPCLDYRHLNDQLTSQPGNSAPVCEDKLRKWRQAGDANEFCLLDVRKAYLQVHVEPELARYQTVLWQGKTYVMSRMGFGLSVAPKFMDIIIQWILQVFPQADNYVDDIRVPRSESDAVAARLLEYGLPTKPAELMASARVLGLQLEPSGDKGTRWFRRSGINLELPRPATKRDLFSWCGRLTSHVPVCGWLRLATSYLKRLIGGGTPWNHRVPAELLKFCDEVTARLAGDGDPAHGIWSVAPASAGTELVVYADASDIGLGVVVEDGGHVIEDRAWLRKRRDRRHINVAELDAALNGLCVAVSWGAKRVRLVTDSKTVASWLRDTLGDVRRVRTKGLNRVLVERRLQIAEDIVTSAGLSVTIEWVRSDRNPADALTRVPATWIRYFKQQQDESDDSAVAAVSTACIVSPVPLGDILKEQQNDQEIQLAINCIDEQEPVPARFSKVSTELVVRDGALYRSVKLPLEGEVEVPVVPQVLVSGVVEAAHLNSGHASWETIYQMIRSQCYFSGMASVCRKFVADCQRCRAANPVGGQRVAPTRADIPGRPWSELVIDTLELGDDRSGKYHCVLVCVDTFTKWVEVCPLRRHDAASVAKAFTSMCIRWGAPDVIRMDNGSEFRNAVTESLFKVMGVRVRTGAVRHPESQGAAERMNRSLLGLIRKVLDTSSDWRQDLDILLFFYRNRPHHATRMSPTEAMVGWRPRHLVVETATDECLLSEWVTKLADRTAAIRDLLESELAGTDFPTTPGRVNPYRVGDPVMYRHPSRHQKRLPPYQTGWSIKQVVSPSTVVISRTQDGTGMKDKTVNIDLLKNDIPKEASTERCPDAEASDDDGHDSDGSNVGSFDWWIDTDTHNGTGGVPHYSLRSRDSINPPSRYAM